MTSICSNRASQSRMATNPRFDQMDRAVAYAVSAVIVLSGIWILLAGLGSSTPGVWAFVALVPIAIGLVSAFGDY